MSLEVGIWESGGGVRRWLVPVAVWGGLLAVHAYPGGARADANELPALVTLNGISGARPGISAAQLESLWGFRLKLEGSPGFPGCKEGSFRVRGISGAVLFVKGRWRAAWFTRGVQTSARIRIGSTLSMLKQAYGPGLFREHALYVRGLWLYYVRRMSSPHWRLRFDVGADGHVERIGFGAYPDVTAQEGCA